MTVVINHILSSYGIGQNMVSDDVAPGMQWQIAHSLLEIVPLKESEKIFQ